MSQPGAELFLAPALFLAVHPENMMNTLLAGARWWSPLLDATQEESKRLQPTPVLEGGLCGRWGLLGRGRSCRIPCPPEQTPCLEAWISRGTESHHPSEAEAEGTPTQSAPSTNTSSGPRAYSQRRLPPFP